MNIDFHPEGLTPEEEVRAWLGPFGTEASEEAVAAIVAAWERIEEVYPDLVGEDGVVEPTPGRQTAGSGAAQWVLGDMSVSEAIAAYQAALRKAEEAKDCMVGVLIAAEQTGEPIVRLADKAGVTRQTIYRWIGR